VEAVTDAFMVIAGIRIERGLQRRPSFGGFVSELYLWSTAFGLLVLTPESPVAVVAAVGIHLDNVITDLVSSWFPFNIRGTV
jgi:hypothetical protein